MQRKTRAWGTGAEAFERIVNADQDPAGWLRERQKFITATDVPSILGVPGARDPLETWYQKKDSLMARAESDAIRGAKQAGHDFEDFNALMFAKTSGRHVEREQWLIKSNGHPWLSATLDYRQHTKFASAPLELKNVGSFAADEMWPLGGEPHLTWQVQLQTQIVVTGSHMGSLSAWVGAPFVHHRWQDFEYDDAIAAIILEETRAFWKSLKRNVPPKNLGDPALALKVLKRLSPQAATQKVISLPRDARDLDTRITRLTVAHDKAKAEFEGTKAALEAERSKMAALVGANDGGKLPNGDRWMFKHVHVPEHTVAAHSYRKLNRQNAQPSKNKKTTWKTSR